MKKVIKYEKDWLSFRTELENILIESMIDSNYNFFKECHDLGISPDRAVKFLTQ